MSNVRMMTKEVLPVKSIISIRPARAMGKGNVQGGVTTGKKVQAIPVQLLLVVC